MNNSKVKSFIIKSAVLLGIAGLLVLLNQLFFHIQPKDIKKWTDGLGVWAPVVFLIIFTVRPFTLIPLSIIAVACGLLFGPFLGSVYIIIGTVLGAASAFLVLRRYAKEIHIEDNDKENLKKLKKDVEEHGFKSVLMLRLLPAINFDLLTYICSKTQVNSWKYLLGTLVGTLPGSIMFGVFGSSLLTLKPVNLIILAGLIILLIVLGVIMKRSIGKRYDTEELKAEVKDLRKNT
ncbi:TVP38/TMEM64 family protein [Halobacillus amylolyticus]|uniref:TVP38/TMEM64 family membrane protein n=1 Tax=Halobacillus amylolyticus TaxID=2932259 RepID=A0ABY4HAC1_9BACI|nr:TVP38/TMEM64 family protein [Halobacillus amylolyticus]UOR11397.1 TVP38/TMEM64 family protein [Halobacillus amylolyticus]